MAAEADGQGRAQPVRDTQGVRGEVRGTPRDDRQPDSGAGQGAGARAYGAVAADSEDELRSGGRRMPGQPLAVIFPGGRQE